MSDGFDITFREVVPESGVVELVVAELDKVTPRHGLHCSVVVRRAEADPFPFDVHVELRGRKLTTQLHADAIDVDQRLALRQAFASLRQACATYPDPNPLWGRPADAARSLYSSR